MLWSSVRRGCSRRASGRGAFAELELGDLFRVWTHVGTDPGGRVELSPVLLDANAELLAELEQECATDTGDTIGELDEVEDIDRLVGVEKQHA